MYMKLMFNGNYVWKLKRETKEPMLNNSNQKYALHLAYGVILKVENGRTI